MANDWIKMREDLFEDPAVLKIAARLKTRPEHVVGYLHRFWGWVSRNVSQESRDKCPAASVTGVPILSLESVLNVPGFLEMLRDVGWLEYTESSPEHGGEPVITIPKFDRHLSQTAKTRAFEAERKRKQRSENVPKMSQKCPAKTGTREEKRREDIKERERESTHVLKGRLLEEFTKWDQWRFNQTGKWMDGITRERVQCEFARIEASKGVQHVTDCVNNAIDNECRRNVPWWDIHESRGTTAKAKPRKEIDFSALDARDEVAK